MCLSYFLHEFIFEEDLASTNWIFDVSEKMLERGCILDRRTIWNKCAISGRMAFRVDLNMVVDRAAGIWTGK